MATTRCMLVTEEPLSDDTVSTESPTKVLRQEYGRMRKSGVASDPEVGLGDQPTENAFHVSLEELSLINENKDDLGLESRVGGASGLASALHTSLVDGLDSHAPAPYSIDDRKKVFGENSLPAVPAKGFLYLWFSNLKDPIIIMLMAAALVSTVLGAAVPQEREQNSWTEGVAIWVAVLVVSLVGAGNDWHKDKKFQSLNAQKDIIDVKVVRGGVEGLVKNTEVVVGDLVLLDTGDKVIADMYVIETHGLSIDESSLTGETEPIRKGASDGDCWARSGTQVSEGSGRAIVTAVGPHSEWGKTMALVVRESGNTPLQEKLGVLASAIGKIGLFVAVICFIVLLIRWIIENKGFPMSEFASGPLQFFIFAVTIVVVAVPEGLPLAVTISLAYSMNKMMKDNNFVRVLAACETMGGATAICSDKTGTLTENRMTVVNLWACDEEISSVTEAQNVLPNIVKESIVVNSAVNSKAFLMNEEGGIQVSFVGNRTECALLMMLRSWGISYNDVRESQHHNIEEVYGFTSERKMASVLLRKDSSLVLYNKGAADWVLEKSTAYYDKHGDIVPLNDTKRAELNVVINSMASKGLRTLCLTRKDFKNEGKMTSAFGKPPEHDLNILCIVGIKDPVRKEVPEAVQTCQNAGIKVRMVTGDNIHTAKHIAEECGILTEYGLSIEGPEFRKLNAQQLEDIVPKLDVLARSSPEDKFTLVKTLKVLGEVVAVTGDGTNDAPALKESDVGLAMGISGTEVAKEAADIVIMDDNFSSIVKSVMWGRTVFSNIRKFLQFQLTINLVALVVAFVAAITTGETPLNVLQLLWVNLIMDSLAALALATEAPTRELLEQLPHGRNEPLINGKMAKHILIQGTYQCFWLFLIFYGLPAHFQYFKVYPCQDNETEEECRTRQDNEQEKSNSMVFNTFIWMQLFNEINARRINDELNVFQGIFTGWIFAGVWVLTVGFQVIIMVVEPVGNIFGVVPQSGLEWGVAMAIGAGSLVLSLLTKIVCRVFFKDTREKLEARAFKLAHRRVKYREHFWQILRHPKPKHVIEHERSVAESSSHT